MSKLDELLKASKEESDKIQGEAKANPSDLVLAAAAATDQVKQTLLNATGNKEDFGKTVGMITPTGLGTIIGKGAKTFDAVNAGLGQELLKLGKSAEDVWQKTKSYIGPIDGKMRQEIPDIGAKLKAFKGVKDQPVKLGDMLDHPELFKAYPELASMPVIPGKGFSLGTTMEGGSVMKVDPKMLKEMPEKFLNIVLHEVQHGVQSIEGFTKGGSPISVQGTAAFKQLTQGLPEMAAKGETSIQGLIDRLAERTYRRIGGEAEARAVQARQYYDPADLKDLIPTSSYDVSLDQLIKPK